MPPAPKHTWVFTRHFRASAYGWKGSRLAAKRLRAAVTEIRAAARKDPTLGMTGAVILIERLVRAVCHVDDSWGILGGALSREIERLEPVLASPAVERGERLRLLDRLLGAWHDDEYGLLSLVPDVFPRFVSGAEEAAILVKVFADRAGDHERRAELIGSLEPGWSYAATHEKVARDCYRRMAAEIELRFLDPGRALESALEQDFHDGGETLARALLAQGRRDDARAVLQAGHLDPHQHERLAALWLSLLAEAGDTEAAYEAGVRLLADKVTLDRFRKVCKALPDIDRSRLARDAIALTADYDKGRWFATLNSLGLHAEATAVAREHEVAPETALRAARRFGTTEPALAFESYVAAVRGFLAWGTVQNDAFLEYSVIRPALAFAESLGRRAEMLERLRALADLRWYPRAWEAVGGTG